MSLKNNYENVFKSLKEKIRLARQRSALKVNYELLSIYWEVGSAILEQQTDEGWGAKVIDRLSADLKIEFPDMKGFSVRNLKYMRAFAEEYIEFVQQDAAQIGRNVSGHFVQHPTAQIPWTHHQVILDKVKGKKERLFYIQKSIENGWSRNILALEIDSNLHKRQGNAITNFKTTLPATDSDLAKETFKSPYNFDFLALSEEIKERDLEKALIQHLKKFMLELGKGFAYVGNQFNLEVGGKDYFLDLLFYNYHLHCFVVFELKVGEFEAEFAGKLNLYINTIDAQIKGSDDKPTIGVLLCKTPNETVVKYSLQGINTPMGIAEYNLAQVLPKELKGEMPTIEELEAEVDKGYEELKTPHNKRFELLKEKIASLKGKEMKQVAAAEILKRIFDKSLKPLYRALIDKMNDFSELFISANYRWQGEEEIKNFEEFETYWKDEEFLKKHTRLYFIYQLDGFTKAGTKAFSTRFQVDYHRDLYSYGFSILNYNNQKPFVNKLYDEQLSTEEIYSIVEIAYSMVMDEIEANVDQIKRDGIG